MVPSQHPSLRATVALLAAAIAACGVTPSPLPASSRPAATPTGATQGSPIAALPGESSAPPSTGPLQLSGLEIGLERVAGGFDSPLLATNAGDGSGRLFVVEQGGVIRIVRDGEVEPQPFLDISDRISTGGERGLLGLAFPPGFGSAGGGHDAFYLDYTDEAGDTAIADVRLDPTNPDRAAVATLRVLLHIAQPYPNHKGGALVFQSDGTLLVGMGDGGSGGDPEGRGQDLAERLGKVLRIGVPGGASEPYTVPGDNPFVGRPGAAAEILHYGLRNPWRMSLDRATGDLWIGDVGQNAWEEVDVARAGQLGINFGWNVLEGNHCFGSRDCDRAGLTAPVAEYGHEQGCAVIGGSVYRGAAFPALRGAYVFGDYCSGRIFAIDAAGGSQQPVLVLDSGHTISSFGEDEAGELYMTDLAAGEVFRIVPPA